MRCKWKHIFYAFIILFFSFSRKVIPTVRPIGNQAHSLLRQSEQQERFAATPHSCNNLHQSIMPTTDQLLQIFISLYNHSLQKIFADIRIFLLQIQSFYQFHERFLRISALFLDRKGWDDVCWMKTVVEKKDTKTFAPIIILL